MSFFSFDVLVCCMALKMRKYRTGKKPKLESYRNKILIQSVDKCTKFKSTKYYASSLW